MKVVFASVVGREATAQLEAIVERSLADRRLPDEARVYVSRHRTDWSVFISGLEEHPIHLAERIRAALLREAPDGLGIRTPGPRRLPRP
jgi:hypothetical protein